VTAPATNQIQGTPFLDAAAEPVRAAAITSATTDASSLDRGAAAIPTPRARSSATSFASAGRPDTARHASTG
jgi:hypothetical protein